MILWYNTNICSQVIFFSTTWHTAHKTVINSSVSCWKCIEIAQPDEAYFFFSFILFLLHMQINRAKNTDFFFFSLWRTFFFLVSVFSAKLIFSIHYSNYISTELKWNLTSLVDLGMVLQHDVGKNFFNDSFSPWVEITSSFFPCKFFNRSRTQFIQMPILLPMSLPSQKGALELWAF